MPRSIHCPLQHCCRCSMESTECHSPKGELWGITKHQFRTGNYRKETIHFFLYGIACGFCFDTGSTQINTEKGNWLHILRNVIFRRRITLNTLQQCSLPTTASCKNRHRLDPSPEFYPRISISWNHHHWCLGLFFKKKKLSYIHLILSSVGGN